MLFADTSGNIGSVPPIEFASSKKDRRTSNSKSRASETSREKSVTEIYGRVTHYGKPGMPGYYKNKSVKAFHQHR